MELNPDAAWWLLPMGALLGSVAVASGFWYRRFVRRFLRTARRAKGRFVGVHTRASGVSDVRSTTYLVVEFYTEDGRRTLYESMIGMFWMARLKGREIDVLYDPADPSRAKLDSWIELTLPSVILITAGIGILVTVAMAMFAFA